MRIAHMYLYLVVVYKNTFYDTDKNEKIIMSGKHHYVCWNRNHFVVGKV